MKKSIFCVFLVCILLWWCTNNNDKISDLWWIDNELFSIYYEEVNNDLELSNWLIEINQLISYNICNNKIKKCYYNAYISDTPPSEAVKDDILYLDESQGHIIEDTEAYGEYSHYFFYLLKDWTYLYINNPLIVLLDYTFPFDYIEIN